MMELGVEEGESVLLLDSPQASERGGLSCFDAAAFIVEPLVLGAGGGTQHNSKPRDVKCRYTRPLFQRSKRVG